MLPHRWQIGVAGAVADKVGRFLDAAAAWACWRAWCRVGGQSGCSRIQTTSCRGESWRSATRRSNVLSHCAFATRGCACACAAPGCSDGGCPTSKPTGAPAQTLAVRSGAYTMSQLALSSTTASDSSWCCGSLAAVLYLKLFNHFLHGRVRARKHRVSVPIITEVSTFRVIMVVQQQCASSCLAMPRCTTGTLGTCPRRAATGNAWACAKNTCWCWSNC